MIKFENTEVVGWEHAIRGMRNPMNSWEKSDSGFNVRQSPLPVYERFGTTIAGKEIDVPGNKNVDCFIGLNDLSLMKKLRNAGTDHRKFMRMITVYVDITAPLYWWKEFDTYKVGTVANSCSTMHKIAEKEFTLEDFSCEHLTDLCIGGECMHDFKESFWITICDLNLARKKYLEIDEKLKDRTGLSGSDIVDLIQERKKCWWQMIQLLPTSYNQKRTVMMNYEVLANIYKSRKNHRLSEWSEGFIGWIESLPYAQLIIGDDINKKS